MYKKKKIEQTDKNLSRSLWRKSLSIDDENCFDVDKFIFLQYQRTQAQEACDTQFSENIANSVLRAALHSLTNKQLRVIQLYYFENLKQQEIANLLNCSQSTINEHLTAALRRIFKFMTSD